VKIDRAPLHAWLPKLKALLINYLEDGASALWKIFGLGSPFAFLSGDDWPGKSDGGSA
jgi:hypothetical protein